MGPKREPRFHLTISQDANFVIKSFSSSERNTQRARILADIKDVLRKLGNADIKDCSMHTYGLDVDGSPDEFAVLDLDHPEGLTENTAIPPLHDACIVANALMDAGYSGSFINLPLDFGPQEVPMRGYMPPPSHRDLTSPWPKYIRSPIGGVLYPPSLYVAAPKPMQDFKFILILPSPPVMPLYRFLQESLVCRSHKELLAFLSIWNRSFDITEFNNVALALMVIHWLNIISPPKHSPFDLDRGYCLVDRINGRTISGGWVQQEYQNTTSYAWRTSNLWLDTRFTRYRQDSMDDPKHLGSMIYSFLQYWSKVDTFSRTHIVSFRHLNSATRSPRSLPYRRAVNAKPPISYRLTDQSEFQQPPRWKFQRLVLQDPFVLTHNHAEAVSASSLRYFAHKCSLAARSLKYGHPFISIFGECFSPPPSILLQRSQPSYGNPNIRIMDERERQRGYHTYVQPIGDISPGLASLCADPPLPVLNNRRITTKLVETAVRRAYGDRYTVEVFGSTRYGVSTAKSDLDFVIVDQERMNGFPPHVPMGELPSIYNVRILGRKLAQAGFIKVLAISKASVPIVKFRDPRTGLDCDINVNDQLGLLNTNMIERYCNLSPLLRPTLALIKSWAKPLGLNNPSGGGPITFSSYALALMTISFFQTRGLLPNLQADLPPLPDDTSEHVFWLRNRNKRIRCDTRFHKGEGWVQPGASLEETAKSWFSYWAYDFNYSDHIVSIRDGGVIARDNGIPNVRESTDESITGETGDVEAQDNQDTDLNSDDESEAIAINDGPNSDNEDDAGIPENSVDVTDYQATSSDSSAMPREWRNDSFVIVDPFIQTKNVASNVKQPSFTRFVLDCQRIVLMLKMGKTLEDVVLSIQPHDKKAQYNNAKNKKRNHESSTHAHVTSSRPEHGKSSNSGGRSTRQAPPRLEAR